MLGCVVLVTVPPLGKQLMFALPVQQSLEKYDSQFLLTGKVKPPRRARIEAVYSAPPPQCSDASPPGDSSGALSSSILMRIMMYMTESGDCELAHPHFAYLVIQILYPLLKARTETLS